MRNTIQNTVPRMQLFQRNKTVAVGVEFGKGLVYHGQASLGDVSCQIVDKFTANLNGGTEHIWVVWVLCQ